MAHLSDLMLLKCPNLLLLVTRSNVVSVKCMLDSVATHSFVHPRIVQSTEVQPSLGAVLTVTVATGSKVLCYDVHMCYLTFTAEGGDRQVTISTQLYILNGL